MFQEDVEERPLSALEIWLRDNRDTYVRGTFIFIILTFIIIGVVMWVIGSFEFDTIGYPGVWFFSFIGAASIVVPVPALAAVCVAVAPGVDLNPIVVGIVAASAEAPGELTGYMAGISGQSMLEKNRLYPRVRKFLINHGGLFLFLGSTVPNPLFDIIGVAAGSIGYPVKRFLVYVFLAKTIKSTGVAYACFYGVGWVMDVV